MSGQNMSSVTPPIQKFPYTGSQRGFCSDAIEEPPLVTLQKHVYKYILIFYFPATKSVIFCRCFDLVKHPQV